MQAAVAVVSDPSLEAGDAAVEVQSVVVEGAQTIDCYQTVLLTAVSTVVAVSYRRLRNVVGCM